MRFYPFCGEDSPTTIDYRKKRVPLSNLSALPPANMEVHRPPGERLLSSWKGPFCTLMLVGARVPRVGKRPSAATPPSAHPSRCADADHRGGDAAALGGIGLESTGAVES